MQADKDTDPRREFVRDTIEMLMHEDEPATRPQPPSLSPNDPICAPVLVERQRRKYVDDTIDARLRRIERLQRLQLLAFGTMVAFAALEYAGVIGENRHPIWARSVFDGIMWVFGG